MAKRPKFSESVVKTLFALSNNVCAFIDVETGHACETKLTDPKWRKVNAEICHIHGLFPTSPRYDMNVTDVNGFDNLLLLCPNHHKVIDALEPGRYTAEVLREMKARSEFRRADGGIWATDAQLEQIANQLIVQTNAQLMGDALVAENEDMRQALASAIDGMSDRDKVLITLYYYEGLSHRELEEVVGVNDARRELDRATQRLAASTQTDRSKLRSILRATRPD